MRKLWCLAFLLFLPACSARQDLSEAACEAWDLIRADYVEYVEKDQALTNEQKAIRLRHAAELLEAMEVLRGGD